MLKTIFRILYKEVKNIRNIKAKALTALQSASRLIVKEKKLCPMSNIEEVKPTADNEPKQWFVTAPTYYRETKIKEYLDKQKIESYLPTKLDVRYIKGRKVVTEVPLVNNLLFVHATESELQEICKAQPYLHYKYDKVDGITRKMVVPDKQMDDFLRLSTIEDQDLIYLNPQQEELNFEKHTPIRIHSSNPALDGIEGVYVKIKGKRNKRLVISLNGLIAVALMVDIDLIERI